MRTYSRILSTANDTECNPSKPIPLVYHCTDHWTLETQKINCNQQQNHTNLSFSTTGSSVSTVFVCLIVVVSYFCITGKVHK